MSLLKRFWHWGFRCNTGPLYHRLENSERHELPHPQVINEYAKMMIGGENILDKTTEAENNSGVVCATRDFLKRGGKPKYLNS